MIKDRERELGRLLKDASEERVEQLSQKLLNEEAMKVLYARREAQEKELNELCGQRRKEFIDYLDTVSRLHGRAEVFYYRSGFLDCLRLLKMAMACLKDE